MSETYLFTPTAIVSLPIKGYAQKFPIHRIFCVGRNYMAHANEMGVTIDKTQQEPFYFLKDAKHYAPSGSVINYPKRTKNLHYEMELAVALGEDAEIFGYACALDMTRRDLQADAKERRLPWDIAKNFEQSAIISEITPMTEIGQLSEGEIMLSVNGKVRQSANLNQMIWSVDEIIAHLSTLYTLTAGDIILTGTPEGVGAVVAGDQLVGKIENVGIVELLIKP